MVLWDLLKPVVAKVHGYCLAGGTELMSMCDIAFVADDAIIGYPPMRAMSTPDTLYFPWKLSMAQAKYLQLTGNPSPAGRRPPWAGWPRASRPTSWRSRSERELRPLSQVDPALLAANKASVNQAYELMGMRTHLQGALAVAPADRPGSPPGRRVGGRVRESTGSGAPSSGGMGRFAGRGSRRSRWAGALRPGPATRPVATVALDHQGGSHVAVDTFFAFSGVYANVDDALADYDAVKQLHTDAGLIDAYDAAVIQRKDNGKVKIVKKHETPTRVGGVLGGGVGLATGLVIVLFPAAAIGGGLLLGTTAGGAILGAVAGHAAAGMSRGDLRRSASTSTPARPGWW